MRVGVVILPQFSWPEARARWASLEQRGFAHGWTYDHLSWRDLKDEPWFGTLPTLLAATTAKDLMTIDDVAGGRLIAAIGAGGTGWDATVLGQDKLTPRQRVARLAEFVTLTDLLLR